MMTYIRVVECCQNCTNFRHIKLPDGEFRTFCTKHHNLQTGHTDCSEYKWSRTINPVTNHKDVIEFNSYTDLVKHQISIELGLRPEMFDTSESDR